MVKVCPPTLIVAVLASPVFAATEKLIVPLPLPVELVIVTHVGAFVVAVHEQPLFDAVIAKLPVPAAAVAKFWLDGLMVNVQPFACVIVKICPPAVIVPSLCGPVLAATVY